MGKDKKIKAGQYFIGIDLGGTKVLASLLNHRFELVADKKESMDPNRGEAYFFKMLVGVIESVIRQAKVSKKQLLCAGMGCPGMIDFPHGVVKLSPNISFLRQYPLQRKLATALGIPVLLENDVNAGLYGEQQFGAARGYQHAAGIFVGTGVGGAFILDGNIYRGAGGAAGEIGHTFLAPPSLMSASRRTTTLEGQIGRLAISTEAVQLVLKQKARHLYREVGYDAKKIKSRTLLRAIRAGDVEVRELLLQKAKVLGLAMANLVNLLNPDVIVLGGGVIEAMGSLILPQARQTMKKYAMAPIVKGVRVKAAELGDESIVKGAAKLAWDYLSKNGEL